MAVDMTAETGRASLSRAAEIPDLVRIAAMVMILFAMLVGASPFRDRTSVDFIELDTGGALRNQIMLLSVGGIAALLALHRGLHMLRPLATTAFVATLVWLCITVVISPEPAVSLRRLIALFIMFLAAAVTLTLARNVRQFAAVFGGTALAIVLTSYLGLVLVPERAIHTAMDITQSEHAGSWRGIYPHKNAAAALMGPYIFIGLFCRRVGYPILGSTIAVLSAVFLVFTNGKTGLIVTPIVLLAVWLCHLSSSSVWRIPVLFGPAAFLTIITIGTVFVPALADLVGTTFTGRSEIWDFAINNIAKKPILGHGYGAFWDTVFYGGGSDSDSWVNSIKSAHNAYLEIALDIGIPGLVLTCLWVFVRPFSDLQAGRTGRSLDPLKTLFIRLWLFGMLTAVFETGIYLPADGLSFLLTLAVFGLRYGAAASLVQEDRGARATPGLEPAVTR